ncbi:MAG: ATP-binding cassette domain-containing protein, partial [Burkholderiales bacterium]
MSDPTLTNNAPIIRVENVTVGYGKNVILKDVSFDVKRGEVFGILGGSGCGKSTLLKNMMGLYRPLAGRVLIDDLDIATAEGAARNALIRRFGVMYQAGALFGSMRVIDNVRLPLEHGGAGERRVAGEHLVGHRAQRIHVG